jgi:hypothetical protein
MGSGRGPLAPNKLQKTSAWGIDNTDNNFYAIPITGSGASIAVSGSLTFEEIKETDWLTGKITVEASATLVDMSGLADKTAFVLKSDNINSVTIYIGTQNASTTGFPLGVSDSLAIDLDDSNSSLYAYASSTSNLHYFAIA